MKKVTKDRKCWKHWKHRSLFFGQKHNSNEEMKPDSIETEIFKILRILKSMKKAEDKDLIINLLDDISLFLDENV